MQQEAIRQDAVIQSVPMHHRVREALLPIWEKQGTPTKGHVFFNRFGEPYQDTRLSRISAGNPIKNQHKIACKLAGIDLITIMDMGGWKSLRIVQRYSSVSVDHMRESINKLS